MVAECVDLELEEATSTTPTTTTITDKESSTTHTNTTSSLSSMNLGTTAATLESAEVVLEIKELPRMSPKVHGSEKTKGY